MTNPSASGGKAQKSPKGHRMAEMNLLDNELVRRYFERCEKDGTNTCETDCSMAKRIIRAMQEPIRGGERFLRLTRDGWKEGQNSGEDITFPPPGFHPFFLRLPEPFQKLEEKLEKCCDHGYFDHPHICQKGKPEPPKCKHGVKETTIYPCNDCIAEMDKPKDPKCPICGRDSCWQHDAVEQKIQAIKRMQGFTLDEVEQRLRELVRLARGK